MSVLLPVRNEGRYIEACLEALALQDYPHDRFEVILLDGDSSDDTVRKARRFANAGRLDLRLESNPRRTTASGLNLGIALSRGEVLVRVDGHTRVAPDFLSASVAALQESGAEAAGGRIRTLGEGRAGRAIALAMSSPFGVGGTGFRHAGEAGAPAWVDSVPFAAYRRSAFEKAGCFSEDIDHGEDDEFNYRLLDRGGRILLSPAIHCDYFGRDSFSGLWRQYWGYGIAKAAVLARHPARLRPRHLVPSALVLTLAGAIALSSLDRRAGRLAGLAAASYAAANLAASLLVARRGQRGELPLLPPAFACIHLAAGAGMLAGAARLLLRVDRQPQQKARSSG